MKVRFVSGALILGLLAGCQTTKVSGTHHEALEIYTFEDLPLLDKTDLNIGGFSGLTINGVSSWNGKLELVTHTNRGANLDVRKDAGNPNLRPFVAPWMDPFWVTFDFDLKSHKLSNLRLTPMVLADGRPMTGLPNDAGLDEVPIDPSGHRLKYDKMGIDTEGIVRDSTDGSYWLCEDYRPSLLHFDSRAHLLSRWVPEGSPQGTGAAVLPAWYKRRKLNRGFDGIALDGDHVVGFLQSPLQDDFDVSRVLSVRKSDGKPVAEYAYEFEETPEGAKFVDKIGDAVNIGPGRFLVIEQNSAVDDRGFHRIYEIDVNEATNMLEAGRDHDASLSRSSLCMPDTPPSHGALACAKPVRKTLVADLVQMGLRGYDKLEGLVVIDPQTLALVNDNDFDVAKRGDKSAFFIVHLEKPLNLN